MIELMVGIIILFISTSFIWWYLIVLQKYKALEKIPGPTPLPLLGNILSLGNSSHELYKKILQMQDDYGDIFKIYVFHKVNVFIANPEMIKEILTSNVHITKSDGYQMLSPWLGTGILTSTGQKWKSRREVVTSCLHSEKVEQFLDVFNSCGDVLVEKLTQEKKNISLDVEPHLKLCALDIICQTTTGIRDSLQKGNDAEYVEAVNGYIDIVMKRHFSALERFDWFFQKFSKLAKSNNHFVNILQMFVEKAIQKRCDRSKQGIEVIDLLLKLKREYKLSNKDIREEINTLVYTGYETSSCVLSLTLFTLAQNPDVQQKLYNEISMSGGNVDGHVSLQELKKMAYLELVLKEAQRMYTTAPLIQRQLETNCNLGGHNFPKGTILTLFLYGLHHDKKHYPDPYKFEPERFLPQNQAKRHPYAYVPFSAGPRSCIGQDFATLEIKVILVKIVKKFRLIKVPDYKPKLGMAAVLRSCNGIYIQLEQR